MDLHLDAGVDLNPILTITQSDYPQSTNFVDFRGQPANRSTTGGWKSALFIIGVEGAERCAYFGISSNLMMYLTGPLAERTATAAAALNTWSGINTLLPLLGAFVADSWLGRYRTILFASLLYILGLGMLAFSTIIPSSQCETTKSEENCTHSSLRVPFFFLSLYLISFALGGHKPCTQAFGADQFYEDDPQERVSKSSFFNWWFFGICVNCALAVVVMSYVQDNISWVLGFGIPCGIMLLALVLLLLGARTYRYFVLEEENPFLRVARSFVAITKVYWKSLGAKDMSAIDEETNEGATEAKDLLRLFPIWATCLIYGVVFAQPSTFFTKQASTLDRKISEKFQVPPAALQAFIPISTICCIPIYDKLLVPLLKKYTHIPSGITMLQRIGVGMILSLLLMIIAALVEIKRLNTAKDYELVDNPDVPIPMSLWWMIPQYIISGVADVFTIIGMQEFFYDQVPIALRSLGLAFYLSVLGVGNFISSLLIFTIDEITSKNGESWFSNNLNRANLHYFYLLLAGFSGFEIILFIFFAKRYVYMTRVTSAEVV